VSLNLAHPVCESLSLLQEGTRPHSRHNMWPWLLADN